MSVVAVIALARIRAADGDYAEAQRLARQALESEQRTLPADDPRIGEARRSLRLYSEQLQAHR